MTLHRSDLNFKKFRKKYIFLTLSSFGYFEMPRKEPIFCELSKLFFNFKLFLSMSNIQYGSKRSKTIKWQKIHPKPLFSNRKKLLVVLFLPTFPVKKSHYHFQEKKKIEWLFCDRCFLFRKKQVNQPFPRKQDALN